LVVILNELTDAPTIASAASGAYDVTTIPGTCLCCTGELTFRRCMQALSLPPIGRTERLGGAS
jgi:hypothetical protein